jgi:hypothetical protein
MAAARFLAAALLLFLDRPALPWSAGVLKAPLFMLFTQNESGAFVIAPHNPAGS